MFFRLVATLSAQYNPVRCDSSTGPYYSSTLSPDWKGAGWYRFIGAAGTRMPEQSPGIKHCGTLAPGWVNGKHPATPGEEIQVNICFDWNDNKCLRLTTASILNCGAYFLYKLPEVPTCDYRYCGS